MRQSLQELGPVWNLEYCKYSFPLFSFTCFDILSRKFAYDFVKLQRECHQFASMVVMLFLELIILEYKKRLLLRYIHHFKSDLINNMDHMRISGTEPSSVVLRQRSNFKS